MNMWIILLIAIVFSNLNYLFLHKFGNKDIKSTGDILLFNSMISLIWAVIIFIISIKGNGGFVMPSAEAIFYGTLYGINLSVFLLFKMLSLTSGPISITSLIASGSFIVATIFSVIYNNESVNAVKIIGMVVLLFSFFLCMDRKNNTLVATKNWKYYVTIFFFAGGMIGIINKLFQSSNAKTEMDSMLLVASFVSAFVLAVMAFILGGVKKTGAPKIYKSGIVYIIACGLVSCIYNRLNVYLAGVMDGALLFPLSNGTLLLLNNLTGIILFKERLSKLQIVGMIIGLLSIVMIGCF